jgi:hypothetical protein
VAREALAGRISRVAIPFALFAFLDTGCLGFGLPTDGPLEGSGGEGFVIYAQVGRVFTDGSQILEVKGDTPIKIVSVTSQGGSSALRLLGAMIADPQRRFTTQQIFEGWPPRHPGAARVLDAVGQTVTPARMNWHKQPYELLVGYRITAPTFAVRENLRVVYTSEGRTYVANMTAKLVLCPPGGNLTRCLNEGFP